MTTTEENTIFTVTIKCVYKPGDEIPKFRTDLELAGRMEREELLMIPDLIESCARTMRKRMVEGAMADVEYPEDESE